MPAAFAIYVTAWTVLSLLLPRATADPGVVLPGAALMGLVFTGLQAVSQLYLSARISEASELYGSIAAAVVTLGLFFIVGRAVVLALTLNAVVFERFGSISTFVFGLPGLRALPRRSDRFRRFFGLDREVRARRTPVAGRHRGGRCRPQSSRYIVSSDDGGPATVVEVLERRHGEHPATEQAGGEVVGREPGGIVEIEGTELGLNH